MLADLLDGVIIKMSGIAQQGAGDIEGMLQAPKDLIGERFLRPLPQLKLPVFAGGVNLVHPLVMRGGTLLRHMVLELDDVLAWNLFGIICRKNGGCVVVDGVDQHRRCRHRGCQYQPEYAPHVERGGDVSIFGASVQSGLG